MIIAITGRPGSGKTAYATKLIYDRLGIGKIYSNISSLKLFHYKIYDMNDILKVEDNSYIVIDEAQNWFRKLDDVFLQFFSYHRHRNIDIILITQSLDMLDRKLVELIEYEVHFVNSILRFGNNFVAKYQLNGEVFATKRFNLSQYFQYYRSFDVSVSRKQKSVLWKYVLMFVICVVIFVFGIRFLKNDIKGGFQTFKYDKKDSKQVAFARYSSRNVNIAKRQETEDKKKPIYESNSELAVQKVLDGCVGNVIGYMEVAGKVIKLYENGYIMRGSECSYY